jgi:hypothetical protein
VIDRPGSEKSPLLPKLRHRTASEPRGLQTAKYTPGPDYGTGVETPPGGPVGLRSIHPRLWHHFRE